MRVSRLDTCLLTISGTTLINCVSVIAAYHEELSHTLESESFITSLHYAVVAYCYFKIPFFCITLIV